LVFALLVLEEMKSMNKSEKFWDRIANRWENQNEDLDETYKKTIENTYRYLKESDIVFDYACGIGTITNEIADNVKKIHANDISSRMIEVAKSRADEREIKNIEYTQATIFDERYQAESFDVVTAFNILHLLDNSQEVVERINRLLKPGGKFISATACMGEKNRVLGLFLILLSKIGLVPYLNLFKFSELEELIINEDFQIVETEVLSQTSPNYFIATKKQLRNSQITSPV
jgi:2-polyprenyl-3-methyl-5-hydroxy-6-metoxy-1,4-benzoquinol methylase